MDLITQIQNYVNYLSIYMMQQVELITQAPPMPAPTLAEQAQLQQQLQQHQQNQSTNKSQQRSTTNADEYGQFPTTYSNQLNASSAQLFQRYIECDTLMGSLPADFCNEEDMVKELMKLQAESEKEEKLLQEAKKEAELWQKRVSFVLQEVASAQLSTTMKEDEKKKKKMKKKKDNNRIKNIEQKNNQPNLVDNITKASSNEEESKQSISTGRDTDTDLDIDRAGGGDAMNEQEIWMNDEG